MINLWYEYDHQGQGDFEIKVNPESNCVWISIPKWTVGF